MSIRMRSRTFGCAVCQRIGCMRANLDDRTMVVELSIGCEDPVACEAMAREKHANVFDRPFDQAPENSATSPELPAAS